VDGCGQISPTQVNDVNKAADLFGRYQKLGWVPFAVANP
jgi:hypothetical protein